MSRQYPFDPVEADRYPGRTGGSIFAPPGFGLRIARSIASWLLAYLDWRRRRGDLARLLIALILLIGGVGLGTTAALLDNYLHRGVESGATQPYTVQPTGKELATNIDMRMFPREELDSVAQELSQAGFRYVRQEFSWTDLQPSQDAIDWSVYDTIVQALNRRGVLIIAVIDDAPDWATGGGIVQANDRPPSDPATLQAFVQEVTAHYGDQIPFVQIWDKPNLASQWGGAPATGETFLPYFASASNGAKVGNPEVKVITPELAVTSDQSGGQTDLAFLEQMLQANGGPFLDVVGIVLDGGTLSPDDRRVASDRLNLSRAILYRDLMVDAGFADKPIWATSFGWAESDSISRDLQAQYVVRALDRSWSEWPWMGLMVQWSFIDPDAESVDARYAVVQSDGTATPLYMQLTSTAIQERASIANTGFAPMDSQALTYGGNWQDQHLENRTFRTTSESGASATLRFQGTGLIAYIRTGPQAGRVTIELDGVVIAGGAGDTGQEWAFRDTYGTNDYPHMLLSGLEDTNHTVTITLTGSGELTIGGIQVVRDAPFLWPVMLFAAGSIFLLFMAARSFIYLVALRAGHLRRASVKEAWPALPLLPDWRPGRRT